MKIISFIVEPLLICRILEHINLWTGEQPQRPFATEYHDDIIEPVVCETFDYGCGRHHETDSTLHWWPCRTCARNVTLPEASDVCAKAVGFLVILMC